jgi:hypothetical protein
MPGGSQAAGAVARRPVEADRGGVGRRIEGLLQRRGEDRLLGVGVIARPAWAEDRLGDRQAVRAPSSPGPSSWRRSASWGREQPGCG